MKIFKNSIVTVVALVFSLVFGFSGANTAHATLASDFLGSADTYAVFGATGITGGAASTVWGDAGENAKGDGTIASGTLGNYYPAAQSGVVTDITAAHTALGSETPNPTPHTT